MKPAKKLLLCLSLFVPALLQGQGGSWPVPSEARTQEGNSGLTSPFAGGSRYQQVNAASDFGSPIGPNGIFLQGMYLRLDSLNGFSFSGYATNLQVNLSTTLSQPDSLSPVFSENIGVNDQIVVGPTTLGMAADHLGGASPEPWSTGVYIRFSQPFYYKPTDGNLLLDIRTFDGSTARSWFDAWNRPGDAVSSVFGSAGDASGITSTLGLSILFEGTLVPEPSAYFLFVVSATALLLVRKKRKS